MGNSKTFTDYVINNELSTDIGISGYKKWYIGVGILAILIIDASLQLTVTLSVSGYDKHCLLTIRAAEWFQ